jgi:hypothetical protein
MRDNFAQALIDVSEIKSPTKRGYALERLVQELFELGHFNVTRSSPVAIPRQTDLLAVRGRSRFLIECKWQKPPAHIGDIDALRARLERTSSNTTGVLISVSGLSPQAMNSVESRRDRPLILINYDDLTAMCQDPDNLSRMLHAKLDSLVDQARISTVRARRRGARRAAPAPLSTFMSLSGEPLPMVCCDGHYAPFVYAPEIPDVDWVRGGGVGVSLDLRADVASQVELLDMLHDLTRLGWSTPSARWSFRQGTQEWHGCGADNFSRGLQDWAARRDSMNERDRHDTEEFQYVDQCDLGFYTLAGCVSADSRRFVRQTTISFQLSGTPLDTSAYEELDKLVGTGQAYFRPLSGPSLNRTHNPTSGGCVVAPLAWLVRELGDGPWVVGVVVRNPLIDDESEATSWLPIVLRDSSLLICDLASWHPLKSAAKTYWLRSCEVAWTSDVAVVRVVAQYEDRTREPRRAAARLPRSRRTQSSAVIVMEAPPLTR